MSKMQSIGHCAAWTNRGISSDWRWVGNRKAPLHKMPWGIWVQREAELLSLFQQSKIALRSKAHNKCVANWLSSSTAIAWQFPTSGVSDDHPRADPSFPYPKSSPCVATFQRNKRNLSKTKLRPPRSDSCCVLKFKLVSHWKGQAVIRSLLYQPKYSSDQTVPNIFPLAQALSVASRWTKHHLSCNKQECSKQPYSDLSVSIYQISLYRQHKVLRAFTTSTPLKMSAHAYI